MDIYYFKYPGIHDIGLATETCARGKGQRVYAFKQGSRRKAQPAAVSSYQVNQTVTRVFEMAYSSVSCLPRRQAEFLREPGGFEGELARWVTPFRRRARAPTLLVPCLVSALERTPTSRARDAVSSSYV